MGRVGHDAPHDAGPLVHVVVGRRANVRRQELRRIGWAEKNLDRGEPRHLIVGVVVSGVEVDEVVEALLLEVRQQPRVH